MRHVYASFVLLFSLTGCSGGMMGGEDKFSASYVKAHVIEGKTTADEVKALYGVPDDTSGSGSDYDWTYRKSGSLSMISGIASMIPGAGSVSGAADTASYAQRQSDTVSHASDKMSGNTEIKGSYVTFFFSKANVVRHWYLH